jgi:hypothetical protein
MDQLHTRLEALEQQMHTVTRRLRWWRGLAVGLLVLAVLTWALPSGTAQEEAAQGGQRGLPQRVAALERLLKHFSREDNEVFITGANLHLVNGLGATDTTNGLGNLIVGYNEPRGFEPDVRIGSHNIVVGGEHNFSSFAGLVVGNLNEIGGQFASVLAGFRNTASGIGSSVSGGRGNTASGLVATVGGGFRNTASGGDSSVIGGEDNIASGDESLVSGGARNIASNTQSAVSGGERNEASGAGSSVSGGGRQHGQLHSFLSQRRISEHS